MALNLSLPQDPFDIRPKITVVGVGGAGGNAVNNMIRSKLEGVDFLVANTDAQALQQSQCERRIQLGSTVTKGLGAGARPDVGRMAAEEAVRDIAEQLAGSNMVFITAGMGGGTGTGAGPVVAQIAREQGILTVGVVTKPFHFEGSHRMKMAEYGINELQNYVDTLIIFGSTFDQSLEGKIRISVVATGIDAQAVQQPRPNAYGNLSLVPRAVQVTTPQADGGERIVARAETSYAAPAAAAPMTAHAVAPQAR